MDFPEVTNTEGGKHRLGFLRAWVGLVVCPRWNTGIHWPVSPRFGLSFSIGSFLHARDILFPTTAPKTPTTFGPLVLCFLSLPYVLSCLLRPVFQKRCFAVPLPFPILALKTITYFIYFIALSPVKIMKDLSG